MGMSLWIFVLILLLWGGGAGAAWGAIYRCVDASGQNVFSDTQAQLDNCTALSTGSTGNVAPAALMPQTEPAPQETPASGPYRDPVNRGFSFPGTAPGLPGLGEPPEFHNPSMGSEIAPTGPAEPAGQAASALPPCPPGLNPLNPLATMYCQPAGSAPAGASPPTGQQGAETGPASDLPGRGTQTGTMFQ